MGGELELQHGGQRVMNTKVQGLTVVKTMHMMLHQQLWQGIMVGSKMRMKLKTSSVMLAKLLWLYIQTPEGRQVGSRKETTRYHGDLYNTVSVFKEAESGTRTKG